MALSGSYDWTLNRDQVIEGALRKLGVLASGESATSAQISDGSSALNALVKAFHADGMPLWAITSTSFTVTDGTASYTIGVGQTVNAVAPLKVLQALYTLTGTGVSAVPMNVYNRYDFNVLPDDSTVEGNPVNLYYQPTAPATDFTGTIKLWPVPDNSTTSITIHYQRPFQDMDGATNNFDFPAHWIQALIFSLAWSLSSEYGIPPQDRKDMKEEALFWKNEAQSIGTEEGSMYVYPARQ